MAQLQQLLAAPGSGPVNWDLARQVAASQLGSTGDPAVTPFERHAVEEALRLADLWLEPSSALPSGIQTSVAWNRNEWIFRTLDVWRKLCDPVAGRMVAAMGDLVPPEQRAQLGPMQSMVASLGGALFGGQLGQALGSARRRGALGRGHRAAARTGGHGRAGAGQHPGVRRGPGAAGGRGTPLRGPARGGPPATVRTRAVAARTRAHRGGDVRRGHHGEPGGDRGGDGPGRSDQPGVDAGDGPGGHLHPGGHAGAEVVAGPPGDRVGPGRGVGVPRRGQRRRRTGCRT